MKKELMDLGKKLVEFGKRRSPDILTGLSIVSFATTACLAFKAGIKAADVLEEHKKEISYISKGDKDAKRAVQKETAKKLIPVVAPPIIMGITSAACCIGANCISSKRVAVLSVAYAAAEKSVKDWQSKAEKVLGSKKAEEIKNAITQDKVKEIKSEKDPEKLPVISGGQTRCMDMYSGREFWGNPEKIKQAIFKLSAECCSDMYVSLNDLYVEIGLRTIPMGSDFGWNADDLVHGMLPISFSAVLNDNDEPCFVLDYDIWPRTDYSRLS